MHVQGWRYPALTALASFSFGQPAAAQTLVREVSIDYVAPSSCPDARAFRAALNERLEARPAAGLQSTIRLRVRIVESSTGVVGQLAILDGLDGSTVREIDGATCDHVASALSLFAALAIDLEPVENRTRAPETAIAPETVEPRRRSPTQDTPPQDTRADFRRWTADIGAHIGLQSMIGPALTPMVIPFAGGGFEPTEGVAFAPRFRLAFLRRSQEVSTTAAIASFRLTAGQLELCPLRFRAHPAVAIRSCALAQVGAIDASGTHVADARNDTRVWITAGAIGRLEWEVFGHLLVEAQAGILAAVARHRYYVDPDLTVYQMPIFGAIGSAGVGVRLP